ncbi:MAG: hypothetical protein DWH79_00605 [Planctomycetota bacterium]|nr:MAG: hypothetical protein DWH79_00605 [Planctomycetota bacterium]
MIAVIHPGNGHVERGLVIGDWRIDAAFSVPAPGESLSAAARRLGEAVVAAHAGLPRHGVRIASLLPSGRPVAMGDAGLLEVSVSLAHERGMVGAAVCSQGNVGIDIVDPAVAGPGLDHWLSDDCGAANATDAARPLVWSAKESAYKAAGIDTTFRPLAVSVRTGSSDSFEWTLRDEWCTAHGSGRFFNVGRYLVAIACAEHPRQAAVASGSGEERTRCS